MASPWRGSPPYRRQLVALEFPREDTVGTLRFDKIPNPYRMTNKVPSPSIVIGVDFGTTFSGHVVIAWTLGGSIDDIEVLSQWPGGVNRTSVKVPSNISYKDGNVQWGRGPNITYTPSIESKALLLSYGKDAVGTTADYVKQLIGQVKLVLERRLGVDLDDLDSQFILTVPAVWSDKAKDATLRAAVDAGVDKKHISLVSEPEAAALYTLRAVQPSTVAANVFTVCDAGGGTVDLISYKIKTLEPLVLIEVAEEMGAVCRSLLLDGRFEKLLRRKMGIKAYDSLSLKSKEAAITYWQERVKPNFTGQFDDEYGEVEYFIPIAGAADDPSVPIEDGEDVEGIFEPIIGQIEDLTAQQLSAVRERGPNVQTIILVGGFGASEYLYHRLKKTNPGVVIPQPANGWSAIVRYGYSVQLPGQRADHGAVVLFIAVWRETRSSLIARRHFGVSYSTPFRPWEHKEDDLYKGWNALEEIYVVHRRIMCAKDFNQTSEIAKQQPIKIPFYQLSEVGRPDRFVFEDVLLFCNDEVAPDVANQRVRDLCKLETDLHKIPQELFQRKRNSKGVEYFVIPYVLSMTPTSASLLFELEFNGDLMEASVQGTRHSSW
ncbi:actin-like ATPase domain-containing protein [Aspergillus similis]